MYILYMAGRQLPIATLRARLAAVLREVERGAEVVVTRSGRAVARLVPIGDSAARLRAAGLHPPRRSGALPRVKPLRLPAGRSLTRFVLEERD